MAVTADNDVDQRHGGSHLEIDAIADMGEQDDLVDPGGVECFGGAAHILGDLVELHVAHFGDFRRIFGGGADDANLFTADFSDDGALDLAGQIGVAADIEIAADDGKFGGLDEFQEFLGTVIEFVVAGGDHVEAHLVEEVGDDLGLIGGVVERALEIVAR